MAVQHHRHIRIPSSSTSHLDDPIPREPEMVPKYNLSPPNMNNDFDQSPRSSGESLTWSGDSSESETPTTPTSEPQMDELVDRLEGLPLSQVDTNTTRPRRASTTLISQNPEEIRRLLGNGQTGTQLIEKYCCGGGCCFVESLQQDTEAVQGIPVVAPDNDAFRALSLKIGELSLDTELTNTIALPEVNVSLESTLPETKKHVTAVHKEPPSYVQPHPPYNVYSAPVYHARELTKRGAEKRTYHFDIDVTDYPEEGGLDFKVGGAIGVVPPNDTNIVDDVFNCLGVPSLVRDKHVVLKTKGGRWPTIWGDEKPRELVTTRRELLTWCSDLQSTPPTKPLFRLMAEYADVPNEKKILMYLASAQGQLAFCDLRTGPYVTIGQLLHAFPSSKPPLPALFSVLPQLMPRFYSLSNDPHISSERPGLPGNRRLIEMAVTIHETPDWQKAGTFRTGVGSGFLERTARKFIEAEQDGVQPQVLDLRVPMFRGLMANPLSKRFGGDGPMMLIGAGVGMAPFRGFILNRLKNANCANKIWLVQGVRDSMLDEIYQGELGDHEKEIKHVVQSRKKARGNNEAKYVQDEVRMQADVVWFVINALDGRIFVCGSSKGMGEGVERALIDVAMDKGGMNEESAKEFWEKKKGEGQYIAETW